MNTKSLLLFSIVLLTTVLHAQNDVAIVGPPTSVQAGETVTLNVSYTNISDSAYVLVRFKSPSGENLGQDFALIGNGSGMEALNVVAPSTEGVGYSLQAQLLAGDWGGLADDVVAGITISEGIITPGRIENSISIVAPPTTVEAGETVTLDVSYTNISDDAYVLVRFKSPSGENLSQDFAAVGNGSGTELLTIEAPAREGVGYSLQAQLLAADWGGLAEAIVDGIAVENATPPPATENDSVLLTGTPSAVASGERYEIAFNYNFTGERWVQAYITNKTTDANGTWVKIGEGLQQYGQGSGSELIPIQITGDPLESNLLVIQVYEVVDNNGTDEWIIVAEQTLDNIGFTDGYGFGERNTTPNGNAAYMRYYDRNLEGNGGNYNGNDVGNGSGADHILAPISKAYRSNWWVNANWRGPIKSHYGENDLNEKDFWVEWQNLGQGPNGHAEFDIRVEKSTSEGGGTAVGFPSRMADLSGPLDASFTGKWTAGSTGRCHINMTAWIHGVDPNGNEVRSDIIIHAWDNSGDIRSNYERSFRWAPSYTDKIFYFDKIGTASDGNITYDVLRTIPGGFGEAASYNLIPTGWRRNHIEEFPTEPFSVEMDVAEIIREVTRLEAENGSETRREQNSSEDIPVYTITPEWELNVMEWTVTGQSGSFKHEPNNPDPDANVYVPNSRGRFTFEEYSIANPCSSNPNITCPSNASQVQLNTSDALLTQDSSQEVSVSPNPFTNRVEYDYTVGKREAVTVELYDLNGRKLRTVKNNVDHDIGSYNDVIDTSDLESGVYIIRIVTSDGAVAKKLIKN